MAQYARVAREVEPDGHDDPAPIRPSRYLPHVPTAPQAYFMGLREREAMYGGAAGGGKSGALLMDASQFVDVPGYAALILRDPLTGQLIGGSDPREESWAAGH